MLKRDDRDSEPTTPCAVCGAEACRLAWHCTLCEGCMAEAQRTPGVIVCDAEVIAARPDLVRERWVPPESLTGTAMVFLHENLATAYRGQLVATWVSNEKHRRAA